MPKASSNDQISAVFETIAKALNNTKLREAFLNGNKEDKIPNEIVDIFDRKTVRRPRVSSSPNTKKIAHVPVRVEQSSHSPNIHKIKHTPAKETSGKRKPAEVNIPKPLTIFHAVHLYTNYLINILASNNTWIQHAQRKLHSTIQQQQ